MKATWPLVGRAEELSRLDQAMADPTVGGVILAGQPGVGKTRLAVGAIAAAKARGSYGQWFVATQSAASVPFAVFAALLDQRDLPGDDALRVVLAAGRTLASESAGRPVIVGVDDGHRLDDASAAFVHHLAVSGQAFVVVTIRSGERVPDPITALWKDGLAERVEIQALRRDQMDHLVATVLTGAVERTMLDQLWAWTEGNPLFLREILFGGTDRGVLTPVAGLWRWTGPVHASARLQEVLDARLGQLADPERRALEYVALAEPIGVDVLSQVVTVGVIERLEAGGLIQVDLDGRRVQARLSHPLYAEVIRAGIAAVRARAVRRRLADGLYESGARRRDDMAERFDRMGLALPAAASAARAHDRAGRVPSARAARVRSEVFARRCPGVWTPGLARQQAGPAPTRREREVASLASRGRSNADVAAELYLSVRTVETHLQAAYRKLGVNSRQELAALLGAGPVGLPGPQG